jgi:hypothetical protein
MLDPAEYCREIETYLCRKNEGHLIRIVGPVFQQVTGWAEQGIPFAVVCRGIDRYCERYYAKGPRRRPVRVEFCEADVLETFDDWRRAVGVAPQSSGDPPRDSLPAHLDRAIARLTALQSSERSAAFRQRIDEAIRELDRSRVAAKASHGQQRDALAERLAILDRELLDAARSEMDERQLQALVSQAEAEIAPFAARMSADARAAAIGAAVDRLVRDHARLPVLNREP